MKIPEYKSLKDKEEAFVDNYQRINSITELNTFLEKSESFIDHIFRGICEAKYMNFTSAQRKYMVNDLVSSKIEVLIQKQIESVNREHKNLLSKYYKSLGIAPNDFLYLSIAQHYGGISPLLDFTTDLRTALFFMADGAVFPQQGIDDIGNYSSLYLIPNSELKNFNDTLKGIAERTSIEIDELVGEKKLTIAKTNNIIALLADFDQFKDTNRDWYLLIPNNRETYSVPIKGKNTRISGVFSISNLNIVAQKGCFVFYLPQQSLSPFETPLRCIDIHKSLLPYINEFTRLKKSDVYPDEYDMVMDSYNKVLRNILN